jgi:hypothetical protein
MIASCEFEGDVAGKEANELRSEAEEVKELGCTRSSRLPSQKLWVVAVHDVGKIINVR